jgi:hypothetical protein
MITEQELKEKCTPEDIKWMVELAEGFELDTDGNNIGIKDPFGNFYYFEDDIPKNMETFPLLLHRAVEGWNKDKKDNINYGILVDFDKILVWRLRQKDDSFDFKDYLPCHLTACEMAIWDCLLNILKQEEKDE